MTTMPKNEFIRYSSKAYLIIYRKQKTTLKKFSDNKSSCKLDIHKRWDLFDAFSQNDDYIFKR